MSDENRKAEPAPFSGVALHVDWPEFGIAVATFHRPEQMNTLSFELIAELGKALDLAQKSAASALILTGTGRAFCAGADLKLVTEGALGGCSPMTLRDRYLAPIARLFDGFEERPFPIIAAINGFALGGGCEMALSADLRIMSRGAELGLPEVAIGATPGAGGVQKLIRHVGRAKALEWILCGSRISAEEAERRGLLVEVTDPEYLMPRALELARRIAAVSPLAVAQAKTSVYVAEDADLRTARRFGIEALTTLVGTEQWHEGVTAFLEKRTPRYRDR